MVYSFVLPLHRELLPCHRRLQPYYRDILDVPVRHSANTMIHNMGVKCSLAILRVNRQIHEETAEMFYAKTRFRLIVDEFRIASFDWMLEPIMSKTLAQIRNWQIEITLPSIYVEEDDSCLIDIEIDDDDEPELPHHAPNPMEIFAKAFSGAKSLTSVEFAMISHCNIPFPDEPEMLANNWINIFKPLEGISVKRHYFVTCNWFMQDKDWGFGRQTDCCEDCIRVAELVKANDDVRMDNLPTSQDHDSCTQTESSDSKTE
ncbi:MAG: hypothetical protein Q9220_005947 [cf. Caloplaca sp. 1 TL-2023]